MQMVTYDLRRGDATEYQALFEAIKAIGPWCHLLESVWLVQTSLGSSQVLERLKGCLASKDSLCVLEIGNDWATIAVSNDRVDWLRRVVAA
jgi:hypothetical protein